MDTLERFGGDEIHGIYRSRITEERAVVVVAERNDVRSADVLKFIRTPRKLVRDSFAGRTEIERSRSGRDRRRLRIAQLGVRGCTAAERGGEDTHRDQ